MLKGDFGKGETRNNSGSFVKIKFNLFFKGRLSLEIENQVFLPIKTIFSLDGKIPELLEPFVIVTVLKNSISFCNLKSNPLFLPIANLLL